MNDINKTYYSSYKICYELTELYQAQGKIEEEIYQCIYVDKVKDLRFIFCLYKELILIDEKRNRLIKQLIEIETNVYKQLSNIKDKHKYVLFSFDPDVLFFIVKTKKEYIKQLRNNTTIEAENCSMPLYLN